MLSNIEYVITLPEGVTENQRDAIYTLVMTYAFPMSTNPLNKLHLDKLTHRERALLQISELGFLNYKIQKEILKGVKLSTIPKSLYQLYAVFYLYKKSISLNIFDPTEDYINDNNMFKNILDMINSVEYKNAWWNINDSLIHDWDNSKDCSDSFIKKYVQLLSTFISDSYENIPRSYTKSEGGRALAYYLPELKDSVATVEKFLKRVALEENNAREHYLIYCASDVQHKKKLNIKSNLSWAFSDGIMGGFLGDLSTGCCLQYLVTCPHRKLRTFAVNRNEYQNKDSEEQNLFYIPPFSSLLRLTGFHEFHHPRTKISSTTHPIFGSEFSSSSIKNKIGKQSVFIINKLTFFTHEKTLQKLVTENYQLTPAIMDSSTEMPVFGLNFSNYKRLKKITEVNSHQNQLIEYASPGLI